MVYSVWDSLSEKVYSGRTTVSKKEKIKDAIRQKWREIPHHGVQKAILCWKKRLQESSMKAEATSITCSISLNMSMAL